MPSGNPTGNCRHLIAPSEQTASAFEKAQQLLDGHQSRHRSSSRSEGRAERRL